MSRNPHQRRQKKTKTVMSATDIRWEVVFVAETEEIEQKAFDDVMGILYDFGVRKGLFTKAESDATPESDSPIVQVQQAILISSPLSTCSRLKS